MERPANCVGCVYELMLRCWLYRPGGRPEFAEIVELHERGEVALKEIGHVVRGHTGLGDAAAVEGALSRLKQVRVVCLVLTSFCEVPN